MKIFIYNFLLELFYVSTGAILIFAFLEIIWPGMVLAYFNLSHLLIFWLMVGIIAIAISNRSYVKQGQKK